MIPEVMAVFTVPEASRVGGETLISGDMARVPVQQGKDGRQLSAVRINTLGDDQMLMP